MIIPVSVSGSTFTASGRFPFADGQQVSIDSRIANQLPAPLVEFDSQEKRVYYYLVNTSGNTFEVSSTLNGAPIALTSAGIGQITVSEHPPLTWTQLVLLPLLTPSDIRARWLTPEAMLQVSAAPDASIGVTLASNIFTSGISHGFTDWQAIQLASTGTVPTGLSPNTTYYTRDTTATTFKVALVIGGVALTVTGGSGQISVQNWGLNDLLQAKIELAGQWLYDALLVMVSNHMKRVNKSWWLWYAPPTEPNDVMFYPAIYKAQIVLDNLKNPEKLIEAWRDYAKWAMVEDGSFRNQILDATFFQQFGQISSGQTLESVAKKRAEQRLAMQAQLLLVSGYQQAHRIFDFGEVNDTIDISLV